MKDWEHLIRLALLCASAALAFAIARAVFVPATFGEIGHYRAAAVLEAREREPRYADRATCDVCHSEVVTLQQEKKSRHARFSCQACHGPLGQHVESAGDLKPATLDAGVPCARCHEKTAGRPALLPLVNTQEHSSGERCTTCHSPHTPAI
jgi:hypothetical protein